MAKASNDWEIKQSIIFKYVNLEGSIWSTDKIRLLGWPGDLLEYKIGSNDTLVAHNRKILILLDNFFEEKSNI